MARRRTYTETQLEVMQALQDEDVVTVSLVANRIRRPETEVARVLLALERMGLLAQNPQHNDTEDVFGITTEGAGEFTAIALKAHTLTLHITAEKAKQQHAQSSVKFHRDNVKKLQKELKPLLPY